MPLWLVVIVIAVFVVLVVQDGLTFRVCDALGHEWQWNEEHSGEQCTRCGRWKT